MLLYMLLKCDEVDKYRDILITNLTLWARMALDNNIVVHYMNTHNRLMIQWKNLNALNAF